MLVRFIIHSMIVSHGSITDHLNLEECLTACRFLINLLEKVMHSLPATLTQELKMRKPGFR